MLQIHQSWTSALSVISQKAIDAEPLITVCGPKSSGKSTFVRFLTNRILTNTLAVQQRSKIDGTNGVALLDIDPGQPEFSPPGQISLVHIRLPIFGPPFSHPCVHDPNRSSLVRAHSIAAVSPSSDPCHFQACVVDLLNKYRETLGSVPLIVNCPGWILGTGLEILYAILRDASPTDVVYMSQEGPIEVVDMLKDVTRNASLYTLPSQETKNRLWTSSGLRAMQTISYFHLTKPQSGHLRWDATSITAQKPWVVRYDGKNAGICGIMALGELVAHDQLATLLNGSLAAVVVLETSFNNSGVLQADGAGSNIHTVQGVEDRHKPKKINVDGTENLALTNVDDPTTTGEISGAHLYRVYRTPTERLPYLYAGSRNIPLDPSESHCIGQALVRSIDIKCHTLQLMMPISRSKIKRLMEQHTKIVLVLGSLDTPVWAYVEGLVREKQSAKRRKMDDSDRVTQRLRMEKERDKMPWVTALNSEVQNERGEAGRIWKVRRILETRDKSDASQPTRH